MGSGEYRWGGGIGIGIAPVSTMVAPLNNAERDEYYWRHVNSSMNAVSFGFVATAILISMFLIMAIFEKIFRPRSSSSSSSSLPSRNRLDLEAQMVYGGKHDFPSPKVKPSFLFFLCFSLSLSEFLSLQTAMCTLCNMILTLLLLSIFMANLTGLMKILVIIYSLLGSLSEIWISCTFLIYDKNLLIC